MAKDIPEQQIMPVSEQTVQQAPASHFTGNAQFSRLPVMPSTGDVAPAIVTFAPNTITAWHTHPHGQYLIVTEGEGRTQEWGKPIQIIHKGDVIWCPPNVKHWHGAGTHSSMTHIAIMPVAKDGKSVTWVEKVDLPAGHKPSLQTDVITPVVLTTKQLNLIPIAAFTATGDLEQLKPALIKGLERGLTVNQIKEALAHQYAYAGFPRSLNGLLTFKSLLEEREKLGIKDIQGAMSGTLPANTDYYQLGIETLSKLTQAPADKPLQDNFAPTIDYALKAHLFGYLFSRNNLSYLERELVTIATLSALGNVNNQLQSHLRIARNLGLDHTQLQKIIVTLDHDISPDIARNALSVLQQLQ